MGSTEEQREALETTASGAPITFERPVTTNLEFEKPYMSRALKAVDNEHPYGTPGYSDRNLTVLQQHVEYFDLNKNGLIHPWETYIGLRRIGVNIFLAFLSAVIINGAFSYPTVEGWLPSPLFAIHTKNIHKGKHGSDSEAYDTEGRFVPSKFEEIFTKYAKTYPDRLNLKELYVMTNAMRNVMDYFGWFANKFEWGVLWLLCKDEDGFCSKDNIRGIFDGSFFFLRENEVKARKAQKEKKSE